MQHRYVPPSARRRLALEALEDRSVPSTAFQETDLVSDQSGVALRTDPNLTNAWGISLSPTAGNFWVSANGSGTTTLYGGDVGGQPLTVNALVVGIPGGSPTGQVFNGTTDFVVRNGTASAPALFIFASEGGQITGWNPSVPLPAPSKLAQPAAATPNAVYKGLAIGSNSKGNVLFAADFRGNKIDVFDKAFAPTTAAGGFTDPALPAGFAPFNVQNLGGTLYVTYAKQDAAKHDDVAGPGNGVVDAFDTDGKLLRRVAAGGALNSPWGLALAPATFGPFAGSLLVGNFGDGRINAYDPTTGAAKGALTGPTGSPIQIDGLWGLALGNGVTAGDSGTLYFAAGPGEEAHGLFGSLKAVTVSPPPAVLVGTTTLAVGADAGSGPTVRTFNPDGSPRDTQTVFDAGFTGGVRTATADFNGDGVVDVVVGTGPGIASRVRVLDGKDQHELFALSPFEAAFTGGVFVAAGDVTGDGVPDLVVTPDQGGGPRVRVFSGKGFSQVADFLGIDDATFRGGARAAVGDVNGDGAGDLIVAAGFQGGPRVAGFSGKTLASGQPVKLFADFFAFEQALRNGAFVAVGDTDGDGFADLIAGGGPGGGPRVTVFAGKSLLANQQVPTANFFAGDPAARGGVRVAVKNLDGDAKADLVVGSGTGAGSRVTSYAGKSIGSTGTPPTGFDFESVPGFSGGVFVG